MKRIKTYELFNLPQRSKPKIKSMYRQGDYVLIDWNSIFTRTEMPESTRKAAKLWGDEGQIIDIETLGNDFNYTISFIKNNKTLIVDNEDIIRRLTKEEIEEIEFQKTTTRYNL